MFCFNNEYAIPAAVAFRSLLENASKDYFYKLYVSHTDVSVENQQKLQEVAVYFQEHASLEFLLMQNCFEDLWRKTKTKGHFAKEAFYKLMAPSLFPQYEKIIISDVDVIFLGDVSPSYFSFDPSEDIYVAGVGGVGKILHILDDYKKDFSPEEISKIVINAAYMVYNLNKMRRDNLESSFLKCVESNYWRILQLEQDVINLCCYPKIKFLPLKSMICTYVYDLYHTDEDFDNDETFSRLELTEAMENPVVLHYSGLKKPWKEDCTKAEDWFKYAIKTPFTAQFRLKSSLHRHVIGSEDVEDALVSNASVQTNGSPTQRDAQTAVKPVNILAKIRRWIKVSSDFCVGRRAVVNRARASSSSSSPPQ
jgi:lipopolysaccharide biosynthesis glycosyltransferase